jgi:hypothetical protein
VHGGNRLAAPLKSCPWLRPADGSAVWARVKRADSHQPLWHADQDEPIFRCKVPNCLPVSRDEPGPVDDERLSLPTYGCLECDREIATLSDLERLELDP